jgi:hypothetical protein
MYSSAGPATIALTEASPLGMTTFHFKNKQDCVRAILRNRPWFDLVAAEIEEAKQIWKECDAIDDAADARILAERKVKDRS